MGRSRTPNVTVKVLCAFVVPIVVFIGILAAADAVFSRTGLARPLQTLIGFFLALAASLLAAWIAGRWQQKGMRPPTTCESKEIQDENTR